MSGKALILVGMHRSGTSLSGSLLQKSGLFVGEDLLQPAFDNAKGFYEDRDFFDIHVEILRRNRNTHMLPAHTTFRIDEDLRARAKTVVADRSRYPAWGWKDPRTTLFLDFWDELIPGARYLVVYRHYAEVVDSLHRRLAKQGLEKQADYVTGEYHSPWRVALRDFWVRGFGFLRYHVPPIDRGIERLWSRPLRTRRASYANTGLTRRYLRNWQIYNQCAIEFSKRHPQRCLVLSLDMFLENFPQVIAYLNQAWEMGLQSVDISDVYDASMMKRRPDDQLLARLNTISGAAADTLRQLDDLQALSLARLPHNREETLAKK